MKCEKCGVEMLEYRDGHSCGYACKNCGWGLATSFYEPYETDRTRYSIVMQGNEATPAAVKIISDIAGVNFLQANELLRTPEAVVFEGCATEILEKKKILTENNISFKITPDFPYECSPK
jgi:large subunit ribosomal protein L7/L12